MSGSDSVIHNPLLVACANDGPPAPSPTENHMIKVLENEDNGRLGRTASSELLSNLSTLRITEPVLLIGKHARSTLRKVAVLGTKPKRIVCPNCKEAITTEVRESVTHWILPFTIGVYAVMAFVFLLLHVNTTFEIAFCIAGITVIGIFYVMSHILNGKTRHFCPKCKVFIGLEKELVSSVL